MNIRRYKHSGTIGDLIYSLALVKFTGGGEFYLHMNNINHLTVQYYGSLPLPFHQGRMNQQDFDFMKDFMLSQEYITDFQKYDSTQVEITDDLDNFRNLFVGHPGNYVDIYAAIYNIHNPIIKHSLRNSPWLTVKNPKKIEGIEFVVNRTDRWINPIPHYAYEQWKKEDVDLKSIFVGLESEYEKFVNQTGWRCQYYPTKTMLELAEIIAGADHFIGNQSQCLSLSIGLGTPWICEVRKDIPLQRNECYFPNHPQGQYLL